MRADMDSEGEDPPAGTGMARLALEQAATARYKKMYDRSSALARIGVWECDLDTGELIWTDGVYDLFELPRGGPVDRDTALKLYHEESRLEMERLRAGIIRDGGSFSLDIRVRTARGNERWLRLTADVEREKGRSVRIFGTKQDVTEEKLAQAQVQALQAELIQVSRRSAMGAMAATLAHELNQPLSAISNYVAGTRRALAGTGPPREAVESGLEAIERCAMRAGGIIRSLRAMTKSGPLRLQPFNPNLLIVEAASLAMAESGEGVELGYDLADDVVVLVDPVQIQQVLIALVRNAREAVRDAARREIRVSTSVADGHLAIQVDDSGPGIASEGIATLFDSFAASEEGSEGVGLSISRTIVEAHGGRISAANRPGGGASFKVVLPLTAAPVRPRPGASPLAPAPRPEAGKAEPKD